MLNFNEKVSITLESEKTKYQFNADYSTALLIMQSDRISRVGDTYKILSKETDLFGNITLHVKEIDKSTPIYSFE